jgi:hypothetical protein
LPRKSSSIKAKLEEAETVRVGCGPTPAVPNDRHVLFPRTRMALGVVRAAQQRDGGGARRSLRSAADQGRRPCPQLESHDLVVAHLASVFLENPGAGATRLAELDTLQS